ncbi:MAG TPA: hypothetical protein VFN13_04200 [Rudaea sp.]|nr:hypothetical protein [Rudaea sp.]
MTKVEMLYGIDEDAAIMRLTKEYDAAVQARTIPERHLVGFGGARFDADTQGLVVATNQTADFDGIRRAGAQPTLVNPYGSKTMQRTFSCLTKPIP